MGTRLLETIFDLARREVVDTNTRARQLYERLGFVLVETHAYPIQSGWLGFSKDHVLIKKL